MNATNPVQRTARADWRASAFSIPDAHDCATEGGRFREPVSRPFESTLRQVTADQNARRKTADRLFYLVCLALLLGVGIFASRTARAEQVGARVEWRMILSFASGVAVATFADEYSCKSAALEWVKAGPGGLSPTRSALCVPYARDGA